MLRIFLIPVFAVGLFSSALADDRYERLLTELAASSSPEEADALSGEIWQIWLTAPDAAAQEVLDAAMTRRMQQDVLGAILQLNRLVEQWPDYAEGWNQRATMYFLARYPALVGDESGELTRSRINVLLQWHEEFPVGEYEKHRNWLTQKAQGNRNPFIDFPDLATRALLEHGFGRR